MLRHPKVGIAFAIALLAMGAVALAFLDAEPPSDGLAVPLWNEGDRVTYRGAGNLLFEVVGVAPVLLPDGQRVPSLAVVVTGEHWSDNRTEFISPADGIVAAEVTHCAVLLEREGCVGLRLGDWVSFGQPGLLGASLVAGRQLSPGDAWEAPVAWVHTGEAASVRILPAMPDAPDGTVVTVEFSAGAQRVRDWKSPAGRIHLGADHPYPLRAELGENVYELAGFERGTHPAPDLPRLPAILAIPSAPFASGRPVEGAGLPGHPTWSDARKATSDRAVELCAEWNYRANLRTQGEERWYEYELLETCRTPSGDWVSMQYEGERAFAGTPLSDVLPRQWVRTETPAGPPSGMSCAGEAPPIWSTVRRALDTKLLDEFRGYSWLGSCDDRVFLVSGPIARALAPTGAAHGPATNVNIDAKTGLLRYATFDAPADALFG